MNTNIDLVKMIDLPLVTDPRGMLTFGEYQKHIPFEVKRFYFLHNIEETAVRGSHAHKQLHQFMISISGKFDLQLFDGFKELNFTLDNPNQALYIPPMMWRTLRHFSQDAICFVLASELYTEDDYFRSYDDFMKAVHQV